MSVVSPATKRRYSSRVASASSLHVDRTPLRYDPGIDWCLEELPSRNMEDAYDAAACRHDTLHRKQPRRELRPC
jgi:hypothetical protein